MSPFIRAPRAGASDRSSVALGLLAVAAFALTLPVSRLIVPYFDPILVALGRGAAAGVAAIAYLAVDGGPRPTPAQWRSLAVVAGGVVLGFPILATWAMARVPAAHGGVVLALSPLATAVVGSRIARERPGARFWVASVAGSAAVLVFALREGGSSIAPADVALALAVVAAGVGYAYGGLLSRELGGARVICWALVGALPLTLPAAVHVYARAPVEAPGQAWLGFGYLAFVSQFGGFFLWNRALALGGIARVSQLQLLQPFLTVLAAALLLGEAASPATLAFAGVVVACVALGRRAPSPVPVVASEPR